MSHGAPVAQTIPSSSIPTYLPSGSTNGLSGAEFTYEQSRSGSATQAERDYLSSHPEVAESGMNPYFYYIVYGAQQGHTWGSEPAGNGGGMAGFEWPAFEMPSLQSMGYPSYADQLAASAKAAGETRRNSLYSGYLNAASTSADYINSEIKREASNAALLGIDYSIDDEQKSKRVNDYFATLWGEGDQTELQTLMNKWGNPEGFNGFTVTRGDGSTYAAKESSKKTVGTSQKKAIPLTDDEEAPKGTLLGG